MGRVRPDIVMQPHGPGYYAEWDCPPPVTHRIWLCRTPAPALSRPPHVQPTSRSPSAHLAATARAHPSPLRRLGPARLHKRASTCMYADHGMCTRVFARSPAPSCCTRVRTHAGPHLRVPWARAMLRVTHNGYRCPSHLYNLSPWQSSRSPVPGGVNQCGRLILVCSTRVGAHENR